MDQPRDFTVRNGIGIRLFADGNCRVIRYVKTNWVEIGPVYSLPVDRSALSWPRNGIPATVLAVALRFYELDQPDTLLRSVLTGQHAGNLLFAPVKAEGVWIPTHGAAEA